MSNIKRFVYELSSHKTGLWKGSKERFHNQTAGNQPLRAFQSWCSQSCWKAKELNSFFHFPAGFIQPDSDIIVEKFKGLGTQSADEKHSDANVDAWIKPFALLQAAEQVWKASVECKWKRGKWRKASKATIKSNILKCMLLTRKRFPWSRIRMVWQLGGPTAFTATIIGTPSMLIWQPIRRTTCYKPAEVSWGC